MTHEQAAQVAEWERLAEAATSGPWTLSDGCYAVYCAGGQPLLDEGSLGDSGTLVSTHDAAFIAAARTAVPEMARMLREQAQAHAAESEFLMKALGERVAHIPAVTRLASWQRTLVTRENLTDPIPISGFANNRDTFDMDGMAHIVGGCDECCGTEEILCNENGCGGHLHYQPVHGGHYYECEVCHDKDGGR